MNYAKALPATGATGLVIGGLLISEAWIFGIAALTVVAAALAIRVFWRNEKSINAL